MYKKLFLVLFTALFASYANAYEVLEAVCKVHAGGSLGTGTCVDFYENTVFVFTNYHVAGGPGRSVTCQFYTAGHESIEIPGRVVWASFKRNDSVDMSMIAIDIKNFGGHIPKTIKFEDINTKLRPGDTILTVGCPEGKWPALVEGHITQHSNGVYYIKPPVENGRSGSALLNKRTGKIIGIITWRTGNNYTGMGMAQDLETIYAAMSGRVSERKVDFKNDPMWTDNRGIFIPSIKHRHLPEPKNAPFRFEVQCPDGSCRPYLWGGPQRPQPQPNNPYGGGGGGSDGYNGGGRLFPTLPGEQSPEPNNPTFPPQPQNPGIDLEAFKNSVEEGFLSLNENFQNLSEDVGGIDSKVNELTGRVESIDNRLKSLEDRSVITPGKLNEELDKRDYVTPGKLDSLVKKEDFQSVVNQTTEYINNVNENISVVQNEITSIKTAQEQILDEPIEEISVTENVLMSLLTALGISVPGGGLLAWGLWLLGRQLKGGSGGPQVPFPVATKNQS